MDWAERGRERRAARGSRMDERRGQECRAKSILQSPSAAHQRSGQEEMRQDAADQGGVRAGERGQPRRRQSSRVSRPKRRRDRQQQPASSSGSELLSGEPRGSSSRTPPRCVSEISLRSERPPDLAARKMKPAANKKAEAKASAVEPVQR